MTDATEPKPKTSRKPETQDEKPVAVKAENLLELKTPKPEDELRQAVFVAAVATLAGKGIPPTEAAEAAKDYAIAAVNTYF